MEEIEGGAYILYIMRTNFSPRLFFVLSEVFPPAPPWTSQIAPVDGLLIFSGMSQFYFIAYWKTGTV
jgi:hypothetical protein